MAYFDSFSCSWHAPTLFVMLSIVTIWLKLRNTKISGTLVYCPGHRKTVARASISAYREGVTS